MIVIGIDPGTVTGFAVKDVTDRRFLKVESWSILEAMQQVLIWRDVSDLVLVIFEDARKRKCFGKMDAEQAKYGAAVREGAGSVKRDCAIWEEFLTRQGIMFEARTPRNTKVKAEEFEHLTGWTERTNEHARDAAMILEGLNVPILKGKLLALSDGAGRQNAGTDRPRTTRGRTRNPGRRRNLAV